MQIVKNMTNRHPIVVVATSQQQQSVHPALVNNHIFNQLYHLNPPGRDERKQVWDIGIQWYINTSVLN
jgi:peroxin-1